LWTLVPSGTEWAAQVSYKRAVEVTYQGSRYRCLQGHVSQTDWTPPATPALWERVTTAQFSHRVDAFIMRDIEFCVTGQPCTTPNMDGCFRFYDRGGVARAFGPEGLQVLDPQVAPPPGAHCARAALSEEELSTTRRELESFRRDVFDWTKGALALDLVVHELSGPRRVVMWPWGTGFYLGPGGAAEPAGPFLSRSTDFVIAVTANGDPASGTSFDLPACGGTLPVEWGLVGAGYSWIPTACVANPLTIHHEWLHQVEDGLRRLSPFDDLYDDHYPPCGQGASDPTLWFPLTHDWGIDPDFPGCGTTGYPRFEEHQLRVHWGSNKKLITNHCKDGRQDFDETGVDTGGRCG
jgi:hypothetical protein